MTFTLSLRLVKPLVKLSQCDVRPFPQGDWTRPPITSTDQEYTITDDIVHTSAADTLPPFEPATFWTQFHHETAVHFLQRVSLVIEHGPVGLQERAVLVQDRTC